MFWLYTSNKLSHPYFEFSLKVKVMGSNAGYFLISFSLYEKIMPDQIRLCYVYFAGGDIAVCFALMGWSYLVILSPVGKNSGN